MKKLFLSIVMLAMVGAAWAQTPEEKAALKAAQKEANSLVSKGMSLRDAVNAQISEMQTEQAKGEKAKQEVIDACLATVKEKASEAVPLLQEAINSRVIDDKKMFSACEALEFVSKPLFNPELALAAQHETFDTLAYEKYLDAIWTGCYGVIQYGNLKVEEQKNAIDMCKKEIPQLMVYYAYLSIFYAQTMNLDCAEKVFLKYANFAEAYPLVADLEAVRNPEPSINQLAYNLYNTAFNTKNGEVCDKYFEAALAYCDEMSVENVAEAETEKDKVLSMLPHIHKELNDTVKWKAALEYVVSHYPDTDAGINSLQNLLSIASAEGLEEMEKVADKLLAEYPTNKVANYGKGYSLFSQEKYEEAVEYFKKATDIDPTYEEAYMMAGMSIYRQALDNYYKYIDSKTYKTSAEMEEAEDKYVKSYFVRAKDYFEKCRELAPDRVDDWAGPLQNIYKNLNETEKADEMSALLSN